MSGQNTPPESDTTYLVRILEKQNVIIKQLDKIATRPTTAMLLGDFARLVASTIEKFSQTTQGKAAGWLLLIWFSGQALDIGPSEIAGLLQSFGVQLPQITIGATE